MKLSWPKTILMVGKGPSLDRVTMDDWRTLPDFRVCVNNSIFVVPNPTVIAYQDPELIRPYRAMIPENVMHLIGPHVPDWPGHYMQIDPVPWLCTGPNVAHHAAKMGVKKILFLGFDSLTMTEADYEAMTPEKFYSNKVLALGFEHEVDNKSKREGGTWENYQEITSQFGWVFSTTNLQYEMLHKTRFPSESRKSPSPSTSPVITSPT